MGRVRVAPPIAFTESLFRPSPRLGVGPPRLAVGIQLCIPLIHVFRIPFEKADLEYNTPPSWFKKAGPENTEETMHFRNSHTSLQRYDACAHQAIQSLRGTAQ